MAAVLADDEGDLLAARDQQDLWCQNGHSLTMADIHPAIRPHVTERIWAEEVQKPIHPDSCLICQANESTQREKVVPFSPAQATT